MGKLQLLSFNPADYNIDMFKKHLILVAAFVSAMILPFNVVAHTGGLPYVKINEAYAPSNKLYNYLSTYGLFIAPDIAPSKMYVVNEPISFEINELALFSPSGFQPTIKWNFGDETATEEGKMLSHTFQKAGTFFVELQANNSYEKDKLSVLDTLELNVVPVKNYQLPEAKIKINDHAVESIDNDVTTILPNSSVEFDASASKGYIKIYVWEFGDGQLGKGKTIKHTYKNNLNGSDSPQYYTPILHVVDKNNLINSTIAQISVSQNAAMQTPKKQNILEKLILFFQNIFSHKKG